MGDGGHSGRGGGGGGGLRGDGLGEKFFDGGAAVEVEGNGGAEENGLVEDFFDFVRAGHGRGGGARGRRLRVEGFGEDAGGGFELAVERGEGGIGGEAGAEGFGLDLGGFAEDEGGEARFELLGRVRRGRGRRVNWRAGVHGVWPARASSRASCLRAW